MGHVLVVSSTLAFQLRSINCETVPTVLTLVLKRGLEQLGIGL